MRIILHNFAEEYNNVITGTPIFVSQLYGTDNDKWFVRFNIARLLYNII